MPAGQQALSDETGHPAPRLCRLSSLLGTETFGRRDERAPDRGHEGWSRDVSDEIATELPQACADRGEMPPSIADFIAHPAEPSALIAWSMMRR